MDLQTLEKGNELLAKYRLCETMLEYMSDSNAVIGQKYKEQCGEFFKVFHDEMLVLTHELMTKCGEEFAQLHCECHTESETPSQPEYETPPADAKYQIDDRVKVVGGDISVLIGRIGTIVGYDDAETKYLVRLDGFLEGALPLMYAEGELVSYVEDSEEVPENPEENGTRDTDPTEGE